MPFDATDCRTALAPAAAPPSAEFAGPQLIPFTDATAEISAHGTRQWLIRTQHAVIAYACAAAGESWTGPPDRETLLAVPDGTTRLQVTSGGYGRTVAGGSVAVIPGPDSTIEVLDDGIVLRIFPADGSDLLDHCLNASAYLRPAANVARYLPVPADHGLFAYRLDHHPPNGTRFGQIFRSTNLMVNFIATRIGPRDPRRLSPHSHPDFEQCTLQLGGEFVHHVRTPWTPDMSQWHQDQHLELAGSGAVIFPPPLEHTSQATGTGANRLIDVFAPPRQDFLQMPGWVLNAQDYERAGPEARL